MSDEYIKKEDAIEIAASTGTFETLRRIKQLSPADVVERKHGEWKVQFPYKDSGNARTCSNCNITQTVNVYDGMVKFRFCPYCGARMKGADDE